MTTQAAERAYRAPPGETGRLETRLSADEGACLHWLPQETILYDGYFFERRLVLDLAPSATAVLVEPVTFRRIAMGEELTRVHFHDRIEVNRAQAPVFLDMQRLTDRICAHLDRRHIADGARPKAMFAIVGAVAPALLDDIRRLLPTTGGANLVHDDVLVLRLLAGDGHDLRRYLVPVLRRLTGRDIPKYWMI